MHNEALQRLDMLVAASVDELPIPEPPEAPDLGQCFIVAAGAAGDWAGKEDCLTIWTSGGWRFTNPTEGMAAYVRSVGVFAVYRGGAWEFGAVRGSAVLIGGTQVAGDQAPPIAAPAGGATVDLEARSAIAQVLSALRAHGLVKA
jgi:hypothetical protein